MGVGVVKHYHRVTFRARFNEDGLSISKNGSLDDTIFLGHLISQFAFLRFLLLALAGFLLRVR